MRPGHISGAYNQFLPTNSLRPSNDSFAKISTPTRIYSRCMRRGVAPHLQRADDLHRPVLTNHRVDDRARIEPQPDRRMRRRRAGCGRSSREPDCLRLSQLRRVSSSGSSSSTHPSTPVRSARLLALSGDASPVGLSGASPARPGSSGLAGPRSPASSSFSKSGRSRSELESELEQEFLRRHVGVGRPEFRAAGTGGDQALLA